MLSYNSNATQRHRAASLLNGLGILFLWLYRVERENVIPTSSEVPKVLALAACENATLRPSAPYGRNDIFPAKAERDIFVT